MYLALNAYDSAPLKIPRGARDTPKRGKSVSPSGYPERSEGSSSAMQNQIFKQ
ncbi:MAG: hypothetical protein KDD99_11005 [Bacteroidetes bacterium]|nr:hypothetical protein [Bacteroidota bacterium]